MNKDEKKYLSQCFNEKKAFDSFIESLQDVADSSMIYYGFPTVPIKASWDSEKPKVAFVNDKFCYLNLDSPLVKGLPFNARKKCIVGKMVHEIFGHWLHTDFSIFEKIKEVTYYNNLFKQTKNYSAIQKVYKTPNKKEIFDDLFLNFHNIVEDPVVEYLATKKYPGFQGYVDYLVNRLRDDMQFNKDNEIELVMSLTLAKARNCFPKEYETEYPEFKQIGYFDDISQLPAPKDRVDATVNIMDILWKYLEPLFEQENQNQSDKGEGEGSPDGSQNGTGSGSNSGSELSEQEKSAIAQALKEALENDTSYGKRQGEPVVGHNKQDQTQQGTEKEQKAEEKNTDAGLSSIYSKLEKEVAKNKEDIINQQAGSMNKDELARKTTEFHVREFANQGDWEHSYEIRSGFSKTSYVASQQQKSVAKTLANNVATVLKDRRKRRPLYNLEEGDFLDVNAIACGSEKIFASVKRGDKTPICAVSIMVDMSGSMSSSSRNLAARDTAMVLNLFCKELKIPCCTYGHYYSSKTVINQVLDFYEAPDSSKLSKLNHLASIAGCNHDGIGIRYGIAKLAKRPETQKILFVLSDGAPNADGYGTSTMISDMKEIHRLCKKHKVMLVPVAIGDDLPALTKIYGPKLVDGRDLKNLPKNVSGILLQEIKKIIK
ncbi:MAG: hypothetical protein ACI37Z_03360 [Candidatus Gastranaerophilaceae bacterium]